MSWENILKKQGEPYHLGFIRQDPDGKFFATWGFGRYHKYRHLQSRTGEKVDTKREAEQLLDRFPITQEEHDMYRTHSGSPY